MRANPIEGGEVERLITDLPPVSSIEEIAVKAGLTNIETHTKNEIFEYENGAEFIGSPLISYFLLPRWLDFLTDKQKEQAAKKLAQIIDSERDGLTFRFSVKATLLIGEKA